MRTFLVIMTALIFIVSITAYANKAEDKPWYRVERSLEINAPVKEVWEKSLDVNSWPEWIPLVRSASFKGDDLTLGSKFKISIVAKGMWLPFTLTVCEYDRHRRIAWSTGHPGAVKVVRSLVYEEKDGKTLVTSREEFTGPGAKYAFRVIGEDEFGSIHEEWLKAIKLRVEGED
jgi:uncharacterized membrane protein